MDYNEFRTKLNELRATYANKIREIVKDQNNDYVVIANVEVASSEYRVAVQHLKFQYTYSNEYI